MGKGHECHFRRSKHGEGILKRYIRHPNVSNEPRDVYCYAITR